jgi:hypothetical protein
MTICAKCKHCRPVYDELRDDLKALKYAECAATLLRAASEKINPVTGVLTTYKAEYEYCSIANENGDCLKYEEGAPPARPVVEQPEKPKRTLWYDLRVWWAR